MCEGMPSCLQGWALCVGGGRSCVCDGTGYVRAQLCVMDSTGQYRVQLFRCGGEHRQLGVRPPAAWHPAQQPPCWEGRRQPGTSSSCCSTPAGIWAPGLATTMLGGGVGGARLQSRCWTSSRPDTARDTAGPACTWVQHVGTPLSLPLLIKLGCLSGASAAGWLAAGWPAVHRGEPPAESRRQRVDPRQAASEVPLPLQLADWPSGKAACQPAIRGGRPGGQAAQSRAARGAAAAVHLPPGWPTAQGLWLGQPVFDPAASSPGTGREDEGRSRTAALVRVAHRGPSCGVTGLAGWGTRPGGSAHGPPRPQRPRSYTPQARFRRRTGSRKWRS